MAMTGATTKTLHARTFATASSVSPENIEACTAGAAPSATSANARRTRFRMTPIAPGARISVLRSLVLGGDAELDLIEPGSAVRFVQLDPVLFVPKFHCDFRTHVPADTGSKVVGQ